MLYKCYIRCELYIFKVLARNFPSVGLIVVYKPEVMSKQVTCLWHGPENRNLCGRAVEVGQGEDRGAYWVASSECAHARAERRRSVRRKVSGGVSRIWVSQRGRDGETCGKLKGKFLSSAASSRWTLQVQVYWTSRER